MVVGCRGYVVLVVEAMWFWFWRLCVGEWKNKTNLTPARASLLGMSLAILGFKLEDNLNYLSKWKTTTIFYANTR